MTIAILQKASSSPIPVKDHFLWVAAILTSNTRDSSFLDMNEINVFFESILNILFALIYLHC